MELLELERGGERILTKRIMKSFIIFISSNIIRVALGNVARMEHLRIVYRILVRKHEGE
jgi:hypothetical protein